MTTSETSQNFWRLAKTDAFVMSFVRMWQDGVFTSFEKMLVSLTVHLAKMNDEKTKHLVKFHEQQPPAIHSDKDRPRRFKVKTGGRHPNGSIAEYRYGTYFPMTDLCVMDMGERGTGAPRVDGFHTLGDIEWIDVVLFSCDPKDHPVCLGPIKMADDSKGSPT